MVEMPKEFASLHLFPAINMMNQNDSIRANFGSNPWRYNPREHVDDLLKEELTNMKLILFIAIFLITFLVGFFLFIFSD